MSTNSISEREKKVDYYNIVLKGEVVTTVDTMWDARQEVKLHPGSCYTPVYKK